MKYARNTICHCGSGLKYKKCHLFLEHGYAKVKDRWEKAVKIDAPSYSLGTSISGKGNKMRI